MQEYEEVCRLIKEAQPKNAKLHEALADLGAMVGMGDAKRTVVQMLRRVLLRGRVPPLTEAPFFLNAVITGPPGTGKTSLARILARVWGALGLLKRPLAPASDADRLQALSCLLQGYQEVAGYLWEHHAALERRGRAHRAERDLLAQAVALLDGQNACAERLCAKPLSVVSTEPKLVVAGRNELIGRYHGHTAEMTLGVLKSALGGVLLLDEAYLINNGKGDKFGFECLTTINEFMSEHPEELVVILAGYRDLIEHNLFEAQPGLRRRFAWTFDVPGYSPGELAAIFQRKLAPEWRLGAGVELEELFRRNRELFPSYGGDVVTFLQQLELAHAEEVFPRAFAPAAEGADRYAGGSARSAESSEGDGERDKGGPARKRREADALTVISPAAVEKALGELRKKRKPATDDPPPHMFL